MPPDFSETLQAFRTGQQDKLLADKRALMKEAGGLAAAGNMKGAMSKLYSGGEFGEARDVSGELRAQAAEGRAGAAEGRAAALFARNMKDMDLERASKGHELIGRLADTIKTPEQLEMAKKQISARTGADMSDITMESLPQLKAQGLSVQDALQNEIAKRKADQEVLEKNREYKFKVDEAKRAQGNTEMTFAQTAEKMRNEENQQRLAQFNAERTYNAGRADAAATQAYHNDQIKILAARAKAAADKAAAPKALTEGQANAQSAEGVMNEASNVLKRGIPVPSGPKQFRFGGVLPNDASSSPMTYTSNYLAMNSPTSAITSVQLNAKQKQYIQSAMQWIRAKLRKESGATISDTEFTGDFQTYFPQPGDDIQTRRAKARARRQVEAGFQIMGGKKAPGAPEAPSENLGNDLSDFKILSVE